MYFYNANDHAKLLATAKSWLAFLRRLTSIDIFVALLSWKPGRFMGNNTLICDEIRACFFAT